MDIARILLPYFAGCRFSALPSDLLVVVPNNVVYLEIESNLCEVEEAVLRIFPRGCCLVVVSAEDFDFGLRIRLEPGVHP